jgi:hypothetical protein
MSRKMEKPEGRRPKPERRPKAEIRKPKGIRSVALLGRDESDAPEKVLSRHLPLVCSGFGLRPSFGFRPSTFGFVS